MVEGVHNNPYNHATLHTTTGTAIGIFSPFVLTELKSKGCTMPEEREQQG